MKKPEALCFRLLHKTWFKDDDYSTSKAHKSLAYG